MSQKIDPPIIAPATAEREIITVDLVNNEKINAIDGAKIHAPTSPNNSSLLNSNVDLSMLHLKENIIYKLLGILRIMHARARNRTWKSRRKAVFETAAVPLCHVGSKT